MSTTHHTQPAEQQPLVGRVVSATGRPQRTGKAPLRPLAPGTFSLEVYEQSVPTWLRSREDFHNAASRCTKKAVKHSTFHAVRLPVYALKVSARSPIGAWRGAKAVAKWVYNEQEAAVTAAAVANVGTGPVGSAQTALERRRRHVRNRLATVAVAGLGVAIAALVLWFTQPALAVAALAVVLLVLGAFGRSPGTVILAEQHSEFEAPTMTQDLILRTLGSIGISALTKAVGQTGPEGITFASPIVRDGKGWRADLDLPCGVPAADVCERRAELAAGVRRPTSCVWPTSDNDIHAARLVLWVGDQQMSKAKPDPWPLAKTGQVDLFAPVHIGRSPQGRPVTSTFMFASGIIGAIPRMGKTFTLRLIGLAAALDVRAEIHAYDLKGTGDLSALEAVAHAYRAGDDDEDMAYLMDDLRRVAKDVRRRAKTLRGLPKADCPQSKVTPALAGDRSLGLHPIVILVDECQILFEHDTYGKEAVELCTDLAKRGPAAGICLWLATQRVDNSAIPRSISSNAVLRVCLKVNGHIENDMVLGTGAYKMGVRATMFTREDVGVAYLAGEENDAVIMRTSYVDAPTAEDIAARARVMRTKADRLTGYAAGQDITPEVAESVLDHLAAVWPTGEDKAWCATLAERLAAAYPDTYGGWTATQIAPAVKPFGITTRSIKRDGTVQRGIIRADLTEAIDAATADRTDPSTAPRSGSEHTNVVRLPAERTPTNHADQATDNDTMDRLAG